MGKFRESRTAKNLLISFAAEAQARTRYNFFATQALQEGYAQISKIFNETADQEYEHALRFFKFFNGGDLEITWAYPAGVILCAHPGGRCPVARRCRSRACDRRREHDYLAGGGIVGPPQDGRPEATSRHAGAGYPAVAASSAACARRASFRKRPSGPRAVGLMSAMTASSAMP